MTFSRRVWRESWTSEIVVTRSLRQFLALSGSERALFIRAYVDLGLIDVALRIFGFWRVVGRAQPVPPGVGSTVDSDDTRRADRYARWLSLASRHHVVPARCLHRSLVLHYWLRHDGLPSELRIGVRKEGGALKAHAWVELGGKVVNDQPDAIAPFAPLTPYQGPRSAPTDDPSFTARSFDLFRQGTQWQ